MNFTPIKRGVVCPTVTPLKDNGDINPDVIKPMVDFLIDRGVVGVYPLGTTGQGPFFSLDERKTIAAAAVTAVGGRKPVIIHTGAINTRDTLDLTRHARAVGADAASVITPWYFNHSEAALEAHYRSVLEAVPDFPVYFYNLPKFAGNNLTAGLVTRLARDYENAVGLKDSSGDLLAMFAVNQLKDGRFNTAIGPDSLILAGLSMGLDCSVSGSSNYVPEIVAGVHDAFHAGDLKTAQKLQKQLNAVSDVVGGGGWLTVVKGIMRHRGLPVGGVRAPMISASDETVRACIAQLRALRVDLSGL
ncbi:MAG: dihydrodipicolinate synthase family protein [Chloroflexota bacterium]|nr:dihydrodipicolinate synthase family protein [Chloroflexota bacterium]MDE2857665.1 dihydrodipicolinate synthase family protein [Chloroflexota bacterium]